MTWLAIEDQIAAMSRSWPGFEVRGRGPHAAIWVGQVRPILQTFRIAIQYRAPLAIEVSDMRRLQPRVGVIDPPLRPRVGDPEGALPHVYWDSDGSTFLCLFDPETGEWSPSMTLAETTVPWTIDWLASYEGWRATGRWQGTGRHTAPAGTEGGR